MRDHVLFYLNGERVEATGRDVFLPLSEFLRSRRGLVGTKIVCEEGDCGACSVLLGRPDGERLRYLVVDSCIQFVFQLDATHVVTVEGVTSNGDLNAVQRAMVECHGSQCGFCTPGFVVSLTTFLDDAEQVDPPRLTRALTGNLCRCTGYVPIVEAAIQASGNPSARLSEIYPDKQLYGELTRRATEPVLVTAPGTDGEERCFSGPTTLAEATEFLSTHAEAKVVAGATDVGVQINKRQIAPRVILDLNRLAELERLEFDGDTLVAGARTTWTQLEAAVEHRVPQFHKILSVFGAPQIRNVGTLGGNIVNASPIADALPFLYVVEAQLELQSQAGTRVVNVNDFYHGYKQIALRPGELLTAVRIPLPCDDARLGLYKVSRRFDLDIASFTAAILVQCHGETITSAAVALGAVAPTVIRARETESFLVGQPFGEATMRAAGDVAVDEISPITDVRGSAEFRNQLTRNIFLKFFHETARESAGPA